MDKNGYPAEGSKTRQVWDIADDISRATQQPAQRPAVVEKAVAAGINKSTASVQYGAWARHWGLLKAKPRQSSPAGSGTSPQLDLVGTPDAHPGGWTIGDEIHAAGVALDIETDRAMGRPQEYPDTYLAQLNKHYGTDYQPEQ